MAANDRMVAVALSRVTFEELANPTPLQAELRDHQAELRTLHTSALCARKYGTQLGASGGRL